VEHITACDDRLVRAPERITVWLHDVWSRTSVVQGVDGGEDGPMSGRAVLVEFSDAGPVEVLRGLTTAGRFTGDVCRCPGGPTLVLRDAAGLALASASLHGYGRLSWDRPRFGNDLIMADPAGLHLLLAAHGMPGQLGAFLTPLADRLNLHEGEPQCRPAGEAGRQYLATRGVPEVLHAALVTVTGLQAGELSTAQVANLRRTLAAAGLEPVDRATALLSWLGRLTVPTEALWGEGALVRQLLSDLSTTDLAAAATTTRTDAVTMGVVNLALHDDDDGTLATAINPALRSLFPPATATEPTQ
jgi:hypothetical protein